MTATVLLQPPQKKIFPGSGLTDLLIRPGRLLAAVPLPPPLLGLVVQGQPDVAAPPPGS